MEPRPIDANKLFDFLTEQLDKETGAYTKGRNVGLNIARSALHDETITPTITPPPNKPLTMEELQEMDGEPVWVDSFVKGVPSFYAVIHGKMLTGFAAGSDERINLSPDYTGAYGLAWLAYRRKPEEVQT